MKDLRNKISFVIVLRNTNIQNIISGILQDIANKQGVYLHIEAQRDHGLRLGMSDPNHYTALMNEFDKRSAQMQIDHRKAYKKNVLERAERLGMTIPDRIYEEQGIDRPDSSPRTKSGAPISDPTHEM